MFRVWASDPDVATFWVVSYNPLLENMIDPKMNYIGTLGSIPLVFAECELVVGFLGASWRLNLP